MRSLLVYSSRKTEEDKGLKTQVHQGTRTRGKVEGADLGKNLGWGSRMGRAPQDSPASHDILEHDASPLQVSVHSEGCTAAAKQQGYCPAAQP